MMMGRIEQHEGLWWALGEGFKDLREAKSHVFSYFTDVEFIKIVPQKEAPYLAKRSIFEFFNGGEQ